MLPPAACAVHNTNLIHPDPAERKANLAYFEAMMIIGGHMGVRTFVTEAGHYRPEKPEAVEYHFQESVWKQMVATGQASFYVELAKELGLSTEEGRQTMQTLFSSGIAGWLHPGTDLVASFAPFNNPLHLRP